MVLPILVCVQMLVGLIGLMMTKHLYRTPITNDPRPTGAHGAASKALLM